MVVVEVEDDFLSLELVIDFFGKSKWQINTFFGLVEFGNKLEEDDAIIG